MGQSSQLMSRPLIVSKPKIHSFNDRRDYSESDDDEAFWLAAYRQAFPNFVNCMPTPGDTAGQRLGIDRVIALASGVNLRLDEKKRPKNWGDFLLEYLSNDKTGAPGWIEKDLQIDYLSYAFMDTRTVYLLTWPLLRRAWLCNKGAWLNLAKLDVGNGFRIVEAKNPGYSTWSVAVPIRTVFNAMNRSAVIDLEATR